MMHTLKPSKLRGLTLVEVLIVVAVLGILLSIAIPSLADMMERRRVSAIALEIANILSSAKSEANLNNDALTVHLEKDPENKLSCISFNAQHGSDFQCKCYLPQNNMCPGTDIPMLRTFQVENIDGVSFEASADHWGALPNRISFAKNMYSSSVSGVKILVTGKRTHAQLSVQLNEANRVRTCSPGGSIGGFPAC